MKEILLEKEVALFPKKGGDWLRNQPSAGRRIQQMILLGGESRLEVCEKGTGAVGEEEGEDPLPGACHINKGEAPDQERIFNRENRSSREGGRERLGLLL